MNAPHKAHTPPHMCTTPEPAKSRKPNSLSHPCPHPFKGSAQIQDTTTGYIMLVIVIENTR